MTQKKTKSNQEDKKSDSNVLISDLAALMFYQEAGKKTPFEKLDQDNQAIWHSRALNAIVGLDKMNKAVVNKDAKPKDKEDSIRKDANALTEFIREFLKGIKTVRCPRCRGDANIRPELFPCRELALRIINEG